MIYVVTPVYEYDEYPKIEEFDTKEEALQFIGKDLERNWSSSFQNGPDDYTAIEGRKIKLKAIQYASRVIEDKTNSCDLKFPYEWEKMI
jgi:hypothetical protein